MPNLLNEHGVGGTYDWILEQAEKGETMNFDYTEMSEERTVSQGSRQYENTVSHYASTPKTQPEAKAQIHTETKTVSEPEVTHPVETEMLKPESTFKTEEVPVQPPLETEGLNETTTATMGMAAGAATLAGVLGGLGEGVVSSTDSNKKETSEPEESETVTDNE